jgi:uncharacterized protein YndB with AHSA1/START domain
MSLPFAGPIAAQALRWQGEVEAPIASVWRTLAGSGADLRIGGTTEAGTVLAYEPHRFLAVEPSAPHCGVGSIPQEHYHLTQLEGGRTRVEVVAVNAPGGEAAQAAFAAAQDQRLARMREAVASDQRASDAQPGAATPLRTRVYDAVVKGTAAAVWEAVATGAGLEAWSAPRAGIDLRVGGVLAFQRDPEGKIEEAKTRFRILAFEERRMLAVAPATADPASEVKAWVVFTLTPEGESETRARVAVLAVAGDKAAESAHAKLDAAGAGVLQKLKVHMAKR